MEKLGLPIREFVYFDREKVVDFVSAWQGGLPEKRKQVTSNKSARFDVGLMAWFFKLMRRGGTKEFTWEEIQSETNASLFERLHSLLVEKKMIQAVDASDAQHWDTLQAGEFVEFQGRVELSALERVLDMIKSFAPLIETLSPEQAQDPAYKNGLQIAQMFQQNLHNVRIIPSGGQAERFIFVASLQKDKTRASKEELGDDYTVFGRVKRKLAEKETFELVSLLPGGIKLPTEEIPGLLAGLKDAAPLLGSAPKMEDLRVSYPAIILTPIAIYR